MRYQDSRPGQGFHPAVVVAEEAGLYDFCQPDVGGDLDVFRGFVEVFAQGWFALRLVVEQGDGCAQLIYAAGAVSRRSG